MSQKFQPGDFLVFQLEAGFALLRLLEIEGKGDGATWHVAAYQDFFPDVETAEAASVAESGMILSYPHIALTTRAFESTQVARLSNVLLTEEEKAPLLEWKKDPDREISDRSVRLMLGLR
ncbi:MAG: hypothetical protein ABL999_19985 [Pyrinomonadaceae bacterium]